MYKNIKNFEFFKIGKTFIFLMIVLLLIAQGCGPDEITDNPLPPPTPEEMQNQVINDWIFGEMNMYYLWRDEGFPKGINDRLGPDEYFEELLHKDDYFSVIYDNYQELSSSLAGVNTEAGYHYLLVRLSRDTPEVIGYIGYIKPGTPAEQAGLKRGDYFFQVNNQSLDIYNAGTLMRETTKPHSLGVAEITGEVITGIKQVSLSVIVYEENPIFLDTIYLIQDKKIGYLVYNFFARDSEDGGIEYEKQLNSLFGKFKNQGIDELIIDLRYNSGGTVTTAIAMASMISNLSSTDIFGFDEYNSILDAYFRYHEGNNYNVTYFMDDIIRVANNRIAEQVPINKLPNLNHVYMIVSNRSASASEMLINNLRPYMGVTLVGSNTYGKNVGSVLIYERDAEKQKTNKWGMLPIVVKMSNKNGFSDFGNGFKPNIEVHETEELIMKQLGDTDELLLATTLNEIFGTTGLSRNNVETKLDVIGSSIDLTPARKNMFINDRKNSLFGRY